MNRAGDLRATDILSPVSGPEVRTFAGLELREVEVSQSSRFIEGRAVPYGVAENVGWYVEEHRYGSLAKTTREHPNLPLLLFHNSRSFPVGCTHEWRDNEDALDAVWRLDGSQEAQRAAQLARDGMLTGLSIGFVPIRSEWDMRPDDEWDPDKGPDFMDRVIRLESRLLEVSLTPTPAFQGAQVQLVRSRDKRLVARVDVRQVGRPRVDEIRGWLESRRR